MAEDRNSTSDEGVDHGVLDEVSTSTTAIDLGATAQVNVILPVGYRDEDRDDDVIADELSADEIARREQEEAEAARERENSEPGDEEASSDEPASAEPTRADVETSEAANDDGTSDPDDDAPQGDSTPDDSVSDDAPQGDSTLDDSVSDDATQDDLTPGYSDSDDAPQGDSVPDDATQDCQTQDDAADASGADTDDSMTDDVPGDESSDGTENDGPENIDDGASDGTGFSGEALDELDSADDGINETDGDSDEDIESPEGPRTDTADATDAEAAPAHNADDSSATGAVDDVDEVPGTEFRNAEAPEVDSAERTDPDSLAPDDADDDVAPEAEGDDRAGRIDELVSTATNTISWDEASSDPSIALVREAATTKEPPMAQDPRSIPAAAPKDPAARGEEAARTERPSFIKSHARGSDEAAASTERSAFIDDRLLESGAIRTPAPVDPWRRILHSITGGLINLGNSKATKQRDAVKARIAAPISGDARFVPVVSRKGGVGKTTVTALLGMALADARDDRVVAVDANPDRGTLAERIAKPSGKTVRDLVRDREEIRGYGDMSAHVTRDETRLDVLASDADPHVADAFSDEDYRAVADIAQHYYSLVLTDTGTGIVHSVMSATLDLADQLVVVSGVSIDEARLASETLTWLETNGRAELARNAIVVINQEAAGKTSVRIDEVESHFRTRVRDVVRIPFDPAIATGSAISFHELAQPTRDAARALAALVIEGIRA
ncbi:MinD/ParA family ATP-binding protein [Microbacterium nanhaiense]|uniref:MinD/ParA family ATP-binding protein n=1 Tax=Microbacterium nanhaiense TaxID=1301026 RepID=UPI001E5C8BB2|nr:MinD/ParA family protein [Microbacterium nanhaiense]